MNANPDNSNQNAGDYWQNVKDFGLAAFTAATGDPEAMKTLVDVLANITEKGLKHLPIRDYDQNEIRERIQSSIDQGADHLLETLTWYQQKAVESNSRLRGKYGRGKAPKQN